MTKPIHQLRPLGIYVSEPGHSNHTFAYVQRVSEDIATDHPMNRVVHHDALYCHDHPKFRQAWRLMRLAEELIAEGEEELKACKRKTRRT